MILHWFSSVICLPLAVELVNPVVSAMVVIEVSVVGVVVSFKFSTTDVVIMAGAVVSMALVVKVILIVRPIELRSIVGGPVVKATLVVGSTEV